MLMTMNTYKNINYVKANSSQRIFKSLETTFWERVALTNDRCLYNSTYLFHCLFPLRYSLNFTLCTMV